MSKEKPTRDEALKAVRTMIRYIGDNPEREGLLDTPDRVVRSWDHLYGGYDLDTDDILGRSFQSHGYDQMITLGPIEFYSTCEHHLLPFTGHAFVAYIPGPAQKVVGVSKLARLVEMYARRLQIQERLTDQIANAIERNINPKGVGVIMQAQHMCMTTRGVEKREPVMTTASLRGVMLSDHRARNEFHALTGGQR